MIGQFMQDKTLQSANGIYMRFKIKSSLYTKSLI